MYSELPDRIAELRIQFFIAIGVLVSPTFISTARTSEIRAVAMSGTHAPGAESGAEFGILRLPILSDAGHIAFFGSLNTGSSGVQAANDTALWQENSGSLEMVVREGTQAPGAMPGQVFDDFIRGGFDFSSSLSLNNAGHVAFDALFKFQPGVTDVDQFGVWVRDTSGLRLVAKTGGQAPGTPEGAVFAKINAPWLDGNGRAAFNASLRHGTGGVTNDNIGGAWMESESQLSLLSRQGTVGGTALPGGLELSRGAIYGLSSAGHFIAGGSLVVGTGGVTEGNDQVFWTNAFGSPTIVIREGDHLPGTQSGTQFNGGAYARALSFNDDGQAAFFTTLPGPPEPGSGHPDVGAWTQQNGALSFVTRRGGSVPGVPGAQFLNFEGLSSNSAGHIAISAGLREGIGGVTLTNNVGIWSQDSDGLLTLIAREGMMAPGMGEATPFRRFDTFALNDVGQLAFEAYVGIDGRGIWMHDADGILRPLAVPGQVIDTDKGPGTDFRTIRSADFFGDSLNPTRRYRGFNDLGQLAFVANFTDGSSGVFVSNEFSIVPEPNIVFLMLLTWPISEISFRSTRRTLR